MTEHSQTTKVQFILPLKDLVNKTKINPKASFFLLYIKTTKLHTTTPPPTTQLPQTFQKTTVRRRFFPSVPPSHAPPVVVVVVDQEVELVYQICWICNEFPPLFANPYQTKDAPTKLLLRPCPLGDEGFVRAWGFFGGCLKESLAGSE